MNSREFIEMYDRDSSEFTIFYGTYKVGFISFLSNKYRVLDSSDLEDIYHQSIEDLVGLIKRKPEYKIEKVKGYLMRIGNFKAYKLGRQQKPDLIMHLVGDIPIADDEDVLSEEKEILKSLLADIKPDCINLLNQFFVECKRLVDIATNLNITAESARKRKSRCLENIRGLYMPKLNALNGNYGI